MDDGTFATTAPSSADIVSCLAQMTAIVERRFAQANLPLNYKVGKTEAVIYFAGQGAKEARRRLLMDMKAQVPVE
eukprot:13502591-Alexandrium_andersonii.AAC.1